MRLAHIVFLTVVINLLINICIVSLGLNTNMGTVITVALISVIIGIGFAGGLNNIKQ